MLLKNMFRPKSLRVAAAHHLGNFRKAPDNAVIVFPAMRNETVRAIFVSAFGIFEIATALLSQCIERTITEKTAEVLRICSIMTRKILTLPVLKEIVVTILLAHSFLPSSLFVSQSALLLFYHERNHLAIVNILGTGVFFQGNITAHILS